MKVYTFTGEDVSLCGGIMFAAVYRELASLIEGESAAFLARGDNPVGEKGSSCFIPGSYGRRRKK